MNARVLTQYVDDLPTQTQDVDWLKLSVFFFAKSESENFMISPDLSPNCGQIDVIGTT